MLLPLFKEITRGPPTPTLHLAQHLNLLAKVNESNHAVAGPLEHGLIEAHIAGIRKFMTDPKYMRSGKPYQGSALEANDWDWVMKRLTDLAPPGFFFGENPDDPQSYGCWMKKERR